MSFLDWLISIDPKTNWLVIRDLEGLPGIEKRLVSIVQESGYLNIRSIYDVFFISRDPWSESK